MIENREDWLKAASETILPWFSDAGSPVTKPLRMAIGFPSRQALSNKNRRVGECWADDASTDGTVEIMISPTLDAPLDVFSVLTHELCHAALGNKVGHRAPFLKLANKLGLEGKATSTHPGADFIARVTPILVGLGPLPHARLTGGMKAPKTQTTRMIKTYCEDCGYIARTTRAWLTSAGAPICPTDMRRMACDEVTKEDDGGDGGC